MVQISEINDLLELYVNRINEICASFIKKYAHKNPAILWRQGFINRTGFLDNDNKIEFAFHGSGCIVGFENGEIVSFDFLEDDSVTFDLFKLKVFILSIEDDREDEINAFFKSLRLNKINNQWVVEDDSKH